MDHGYAKYPPEPDVAWGAKPNGDRTIRADVQAAVGINGMQVATHVLDPGADAGEATPWTPAKSRNRLRICHSRRSGPMLGFMPRDNIVSHSLTMIY
jgi:hypothetical protein